MLSNNLNTYNIIEAKIFCLNCYQMNKVLLINGNRILLFTQ